MNEEITINDVAREAAVSVSTVSRVLNGRDRVSPATKKRVLKVAERLNYTPNSFAVSMIKKKSNMIAVVVPDILNPFYTAVIKGVESIVKKHGYFTFVSSTDDNYKEEADLLKGSFTKSIDGLILIGSHKEASFYQSISKDVVLVDRYQEKANLDGVVIDNYGGAYSAIEHGINYGHKKIAIINGLLDFNDGQDRFKGYKDAIEDHGIEFNSDYHIQGSWQEENGYNAAKKLLSMSTPPTLIFATNNLICEGVIAACRDMEIILGKDISLIGFDENKFSEFIRPEVTVVRRPTFEMGTTAARLLLEKFDEEQHETRKITLGVELVKRGSVKNLND